MEKFKREVQRIALRTIEASDPTKLLEGTVISTSPIKIRFSDKLVVEGAGLKICKSVFSSLATGQRVVAIRWQGGKSYLIIDEVVDG